MKTLVQTDFGRDHLLIGCVHTLALPGTPLYDRAGGMRKIVKQAKEEAKILEEAGFHALLYTNESDMPYEGTMPIEVVAAMTEVKVSPDLQQEVLALFGPMRPQVVGQ